VYRNETEPVLNYYREKGVVTEVNGVGTIGEIFGRIKDLLDSL